MSSTDPDALSVEYRRSRGWAPAGPTMRISCDLPRDLVRRLNRQARMTGLPRRDIIEAAVVGIVRDFEAIDGADRHTEP